MDAWMTSSFTTFRHHKETDIIHVVVGLYWDGSWKMSKCGRNIDGTPVCAVCATFLFSPRRSIPVRTHGIIESVC